VRVLLAACSPGAADDEDEHAASASDIAAMTAPAASRRDRRVGLADVIRHRSSAA
jgi:hypothetical protein